MNIGKNKRNPPATYVYFLFIQAFFATVTQLDEEEGIEEEVNLLNSLEKLVAEFCDAADRKDFSSALDIVKVRNYMYVLLYT